MLLLLMPAPALFRFDPNIVLQKYYDTFKMWFMFMTLDDFFAKMTLKITVKSSKATVFWNGISDGLAYFEKQEAAEWNIERERDTFFLFLKNKIQGWSKAILSVFYDFGGG